MGIAMLGCSKIIVNSTLISSCDPDFETKFIEALESEFEENLNSCELALAIQFPVEAIRMFRNKSIAYAYTEAVFGGNGRNDCSDAFRHAFFNAINARDVHHTIALEFGKAHECDTPNHLYMEKSMDLYNNEVGNLIGKANKDLNNDQIKLKIIEAMRNGELKVLQDLDLNGLPKTGTTTKSSLGCI